MILDRISAWLHGMSGAPVPAIAQPHTARVTGKLTALSHNAVAVVDADPHSYTLAYMRVPTVQNYNAQSVRQTATLPQPQTVIGSPTTQSVNYPAGRA